LTIDPEKLEALIAQGLDTFYGHRLGKIQKTKLKAVLSRKNPYLFQALATEQASEMVQQILSAYLSSSDETMFGNDFFEPIAREMSGGHTSDAKGVDIVVEDEKRIVAYALKSGPNALNASAKDKQASEFGELRSRLHKLRKQFDPVLPAAYGKVNGDPTAKHGYRVRSGQTFWRELTGDPEFYLKLITLMKDIPAKHREAYQPEWDAAVNRLTREFLAEFCFPDGRIHWEKLTRFVSAEE